MHRYRLPCRLLGVGLTVFAAGCQVPSARENAAAAVELVALQVDTPLEWRRDPAADEAARQRAAMRLEAPLALDDAIAVGFLLSPDLQIVFEQLEISRSDLIAAATPPNPVAVVGTRKPGGDLAAFYPDQSISFGVLQNVIALLTMPDRKAVARLDLDRARDEAAQRVVAFVASVTEAWIEYGAAVEVAALRDRALGMVRSAYEQRLAQPPSADADSRGILHSQYESLLREESDAARARQQAQTARHRLAGLMGTAGWRDDWQIAAGLPVPPEADPDAAALEAAAMRQRSDLLAAAHAFESRLRALATRNRFRWLDTLEIGIFRDKAIGGTAFTGPNAVFEVSLFDQRQGALLAADAELQIALRRLQSLQQVARTEVRTHAGAMAAARWNLRQFDERLRPHRRVVATEAGAGDAELAYADVADGIERVALIADYWRARVALALASGDWRSAGVAR